MLTRLLMVTASFVIATPALAGGCGMGAHTHDPREMAIKYFDKMDKNGDELLTKDEFTNSSFSKILKSFDILQPNEDGVVEKKAFTEAFIKAHSKPKTEA